MPTIPQDIAFQLLVALNHLVREAEASGQPLGDWADKPFALAKEAVDAAAAALNKGA